MVQLVPAETLAESRVAEPDAGLATVGATGAGGENGTLAGVPSAARIGGFVPGQVIGGRYTLLEVFGEGGMGTVYRAEQSQPVKRQVALKLIKVGMDSRTVLARLDAERQALAMMDHPNIASYSFAALGRHAEALKLSEETLALRKARLGPDHPATLASMDRLADSSLAAGRMPEALTLLEAYSTANPKTVILSLKLAALQTWFGRNKDLVATRRRLLATANGNDNIDLDSAGQTARALSLIPSAEPEVLDAAVALARRAVDLGKLNNSLDYYNLDLGMAEYRAGHFAEADAALTAAVNSPIIGHPSVTPTPGFYRAMSQFRQRKPDEARELAVAATAKMNPLRATR